MAPLIIGRFAYLIGLFNIFSNSIRPFKASAKKLESYLPLFVNSTAFATAVFTGIALIIIARSLIRRKRRAWNLAVIILLINLISDFFRYYRHPLQLILSGGLLIATRIYNLSDTVFLDSARDFLDIWDIGKAMIKASCFGVLIAIIGCSWGLTTTGGAKGVGQSTTTAVVTALLVIFISNFFLSWIMFQGLKL